MPAYGTGPFGRGVYGVGLLPGTGSVFALEWGLVSDRRYESGVDRGVLYPQVGPGVVWNGLIAINETPEREGSDPVYFDGTKQRNPQSVSAFRASLEAFSSPKEFEPSLGNKAVQKGFYLTNQPKEQFGLSWRTKINDDETAHKIHILYNATATLSTRSRQTKAAVANTSNLSLTIDAVPVSGLGFRPSPHFVVDSTKTPAPKILALEEILYGTNLTAPRLPTPAELTALFA